MKMVANETELRKALKEKAQEITIVTSYADTVKKKYGSVLRANPISKCVITGVSPWLNHFLDPVGDELAWYKVQSYMSGRLVIEREE